MLTLAFPNVDPVLIELGPFALRWYALAYIVGLLFGWRYLRWVVRRPGWRLTPEAIDDLLFYATLGVVLGGRLGFVLFYNFDYYLSHPLQIFAVWQGGMSFHGGLLGVIVACLLTARQHGVAPLEVGDAASIAAPIGLFLGRLANFVNGELYGRVSDVPWAMVFPTGGPLARHPSQLYEAFFEGLVLFAVMAWLASRPRHADQMGLLSGVFLAGYGIARFMVEFVREPDPQLGLLFGFLTMGQLLSLPMIAAGLWLIRRAQALPRAA
ncbi:MAG: prolipoprotein diacylglyceryl transferase [Pseudomonadota bacterium]